MIKLLSLFALLLFATSSAFSQNISVISGAAVDAADGKALKGATIVLRNSAEKLLGGAMTDGKGEFVYGNVAAGKYLLTVRFIGYDSLRKVIDVAAGDTLRLGALRLKLSAVASQGVEVTGNAIRVEVRGDTAEYNASQFKTDKNAAAEDLIRKMPGVEVDQSGQVRAQGEQVRRVLVDGKPFFGGDPTAALKNLPSDVIDKIQVFDQMSDQSAFTRFDDGDRTKTLNIVMRADRKRGQFGKLYGGYGTDDRYSAGGNVNLFDGDRRISIIGMSNNINQQNFSIQDILGAIGGGGDPMRQRMGSMMQAFGGGGGGRMGGIMRMFGGGGGPGGGGSAVGDFLVQQGDGITQAHSFGLNYSDTWAKNLSVTGSYFVNLSDNTTDQTINQQYFLAGNETQTTHKDNSGDTRNLNHRLNLRVDYTVDSSSSFSLTPRLTFQSVEKTQTSFNTTINAENTTLNTSDARSASETQGMNFNNELLYRYRFATEGRTFSMNFRTGYNENDGTTNTVARNSFPQQNIENDSVLQRAPADGRELSLGANVSYTEPLTKDAILQLSYNANSTKNTADRKTFSYDTLSSAFDRLNPNLSNESESRYITHRPGATIRYNFDQTTNLSIGADFQSAELSVTQSFPLSFDTSRTFVNILPSVNFSMRPTMMSNIRARYRTSTNQPTISQLQTVVDNSDPVRLTVGNAALRQELTHSVFAHYGSFNMMSASAVFFMISANYTADKITTSSVIAQNDTLLPGDLRLRSGAQLTQPVNLNGAWTGNIFSTYSFPVEPLDSLKLNLSFNAGAMFSRTPTLVNSVENLADNVILTPSFAVTSNISENLDFSLSWRTAYTLVSNSLRTELNDNYYTHTFYGRFNWIFWGGVVLSGDMSYIINGGLSGGFNQTVPLLSAGLGYRLLDGDAEVKLSVFDVLKQNQSVARNVTGTYIEDARTAVLQRYGLLTFTYNLRRFGQ